MFLSGAVAVKGADILTGTEPLRRTPWFKDAETVSGVAWFKDAETVRSVALRSSSVLFSGAVAVKGASPGFTEFLRLTL